MITSRYQHVVLQDVVQEKTKYLYISGSVSQLVFSKRKYELI